MRKYGHQTRVKLPKIEINRLDLTKLNMESVEILSAITDGDMRLRMTLPKGEDEIAYHARYVWGYMTGRKGITGYLPRTLSTKAKKRLAEQLRTLGDVFMGALERPQRTILNKATVDKGKRCKHGAWSRYCAICRETTHEYEWRYYLPLTDKETGEPVVNDNGVQRRIPIQGVSQYNEYRGKYDKDI